MGRGKAIESYSSTVCMVLAKVIDERFAVWLASHYWPQNATLLLL